MSLDSRQEKAKRIRRLLREEGESVTENTQGFNEGRYNAVSDFDQYEELKSEARRIKEESIDRLPELIDELTETVEANGGTVYLATDREDANRYIESVTSDHDADRVVKSKSMTSEELEINEHLEAINVDVVETDLGEWVLQVAEEAPSHLVAPAIHKSRQQIAELFNDRFDLDEPLETAEELTEFARERLGELIKDADIGMTGANFITADTGTIALVTSEGNARKTVDATETHIAVAGVEKIIPTVENLRPFVELIGRSGTGQEITSYVSLLTPPVSAPTIEVGTDESSVADSQNEREFHLVLIDNGRLDLRDDDQLRETLYCIRCSACLNSCANFQHVGGHAFGGETYTGGIGTGWETAVNGIESAAEFNDLCTGCTRCVNACPVKIDVPWINTVVRNRINQGSKGQFDFLVEGLTPDEEEGGVSLQKLFFGNYAALAKMGSATAPISNWIPKFPGARWVLDRFIGIDPRRELPQFQRQTLRDWFVDRGGSHVSDSHREAVLYPDPSTNYVQVERGQAAVRVLEALGVEVTLPDLPASGRAPLSQGMVDTAERQARELSTALDGHIEAGREIVVIEPSDLAMLRADYEKLLDDDTAQRLSEHSYEVMEYVYGLVHHLESETILSNLLSDATEDTPIAYHSHCQQRTLGLEVYTTEVLEALGYDIVTSDVECCGMAGSFGYKSQFFDLSVDVADPLRDHFSTLELQDSPLVASGISCSDQLEGVVDRSVIHPVELIDPDRSSNGSDASPRENRQ